MKLILFFLFLTLLFLPSCQPTNISPTINCVNNFSTLGSFTDSRDNNVYSTVTIGTQTWMSENLRFQTQGAFFNPNNPCQSYGALYDWATIMNGDSSSFGNPSGVQGICPNGWHIPSDSEWNELEISVGMAPQDTLITDFRGTHTAVMKSMDGWKGALGNGSNSFGFNAFPAGFYSGNFVHDFEEFAVFWTSSESNTNNFSAWRRGLSPYFQGPSRIVDSKTRGFSCRCVKN